MNKRLAVRTLEDMREVSMQPNASGPETLYYMIRGGAEMQNITVMESGTVGGEYIKTYGHYHIDDFEEVYKVLEGEAIVLFQTRKKSSDGTFIDDGIVSAQAIRLKAGDSITIPPFAGHLLVNIGKTWLVTIDNSPVNINDDPAFPKHADYEPVKKMGGFAYFVIEKDGEPTLVKNPRYTNVPDISIENFIK